MKTLIILSAFLLVLSSCNKECPVPDPSDSTYIPDPDQGYDSDPNYDPDSDPDDDPAPDPGDGDSDPCRYGTHTIVRTAVVSHTPIN